MPCPATPPLLQKRRPSAGVEPHTIGSPAATPLGGVSLAASGELSSPDLRYQEMGLAHSLQPVRTRVEHRSAGQRASQHQQQQQQQQLGGSGASGSLELGGSGSSPAMSVAPTPR